MIIYFILTHLREAEVLLPFKKACYVTPPDRIQGPAPKRPRTEAVTSETGKKRPVKVYGTYS